MSCHSLLQSSLKQRAAESTELRMAKNSSAGNLRLYRNASQCSFDNHRQNIHNIDGVVILCNVFVRTSQGELIPQPDTTAHSLPELLLILRNEEQSAKCWVGSHKAAVDLHTPTLSEVVFTKKGQQVWSQHDDMEMCKECESRSHLTRPYLTLGTGHDYLSTPRR